MNRINRKFGQLRKEGRSAFIAYITAGDPDLGYTERLVPALEKNGVDIVELGIPFSDPLADGPVIQAASSRALNKGATLDKIFKLSGKIRKRSQVPVVFMTYYNPVLRYGEDAFMRSCARHGVDGVIIPDLPVEEAGNIIRKARKAGVCTIFLVAPTSTAGRIKAITAASSGFVYYVSLTGVTGARKSLSASVASNVRRIKSVTSKPVAVGFGVSDPSQARLVARFADGVIVGSAIVGMIGAKKPVGAILDLVRKLSGAVHEA